MPLVRYEIRNEYSHANPELYKAAAKDDPQRLLEGVAMAGLVGIVRQLGDMAEFAAELFHKLHEEVMATAARGHDLLVRVQQLEAEIPAVEKSLLSGNNQLRFVYASGVEWHANIHNNQNHLTQGDLPWFIRSSYEECRAPPRLFILDKFDVAGAGACLKRYTDPSFFRMEWASSELMKAEKEQRDKQAQRIKKKRRRRRNGEIKEGTNVSQTHPRVRYSSLDATFGIYNQKLNSNSQSRMASNTPTLDKIARDDHWQENTGKVTTEFKGDNVQPDVDTGSWYEISNGVADSEILKVSEQSIEVEGSSGKYAEADTEMYFTDDEFMDSDSKPMVDAGGDDGSDAEQFVDALTTMDSEVETDTESKVKLEIDSDFNSEVKKETAGKLSRHNEASEGHIFDAEEDLISIQPATEILEPIKKTDSVMSSTNPVKTEPYAPLDEDDDLLSVDEDDGSSAPNTEISVPISEDHIETGSIDQDSKVPQSPELSSPDHTGLENISGRFHFRPGPAILLANGDENGYLHSLGSLSYHRQAKSTDILTESNLIITEKKGSDEPESGPAKSPEEFSPRSSTESIILQPLQFTTEYSNLQDISDDNEDMDGVQVSSGSSSFSSSTLSSPRFTLLTTTTFHVVAEADPKSPPSNQLSTESSLTSPISNALHSPMPPVKLIPVSSTSSESQPQSLHFELLQPTSLTLNSSITMADLGELPPRSPPLPPLQWRIIKPQHSSPPSAAKPMVPPPPPAPPIPPVMPAKILQDRLPSVVPAVKLERRDSVIKAIVSHDKSRLKNITKQDSFPIQKPLGDREVLLEQIRTRSFSLRHTVKEKNEGPRSITNINVAAILEKANAIRQAFTGSDDDEDDDDWSDASNHI